MFYHGVEKIIMQTIKAQVVSDVHLEFSEAPSIKQHPEAQLILLAGDIGLGTTGMEWAKKTFKNVPLIYVAGNHEYYGGTIPKVNSDLKQHSSHPYLFGNRLEYVNDDFGYRVLATTLWTDFGKHVNLVREYQATELAKEHMRDYKMIGANSHRNITPDDVKYFHERDVKWLTDKLSNETTYKTIVVTHHAPSIKSVGIRFQNRPVDNHLFYTDLENLMYDYEPELWVHGHMHNSVDYMIENTRVVSNPRGYSHQGQAGQENYDFNNSMIVEV